MTKPKSAMIFAAGFVTRMGSLTRETPKPLIHVNGEPMINHAIGWAKEAALSPIVANVHHLPEPLIAHLATKGVKAVREQEILETGGGLRAALSMLGEGPLFTLNSDAMLRGPNPVSFLSGHWKDDMKALLLLVDHAQAKTTREVADFSLEHGEIARNGNYFFVGIQIINPMRMNEIDSSAFSLNAYCRKTLVRS